MCAIVGVVGPARPDAAFAGLPPLRGALDALAHRGPDGEGQALRLHGGRACALGHRRLAVIDPSPAGRQPMTGCDGPDVTVVFNGEIYNFEALRAELSAAGHGFRSRSDTEVLVHGYEAWGDAVLDRLRGMFALALWDGARARLLLARDRLGEKPLYWTALRLAHGPGVAFASEPKGLHALRRAAAADGAPAVSTELDPAALVDYLTFLYIPPPRSAVRGIHQLPPGGALVVEADGSTHTRRWWRPRPLPAGAIPDDDAELEAELRRRVDVAVGERLVSDVPLGAFLSGGLDSTAIVASMARRASRPVRTFCVTFDDAALYDERAFARAAAERFGTEHVEIPARPRVADGLDAVVRAFDEPFGNPTALLLGLLSRETRRHVTVALSGDGGDELFLGYPRYAGARVAPAWTHLPGALRRAAAHRLAPRMPESLAGRHALRRAREFVSLADRTPERMYAGWVTYFDAAERAALLTPGALAAAGDPEPLTYLDALFDESFGPGLADRAAVVDTRSFLPNNVLAYADRLSMAHALELRTPFCDPDLAEFCLSIPAARRMRGLETKALMRRALGADWPEAVRRRGKLGFNPPMGLWLRGELAPIADALLEPGRLARGGLFRPEAVTRLREELATGRRDRSLHLWALIVFEHWRTVYGG